MFDIYNLLKQIEENTKPDNSAIWIAIISSISAIAGAAIGAFLLYRGTNKQIKSAAATEDKKLKATIITAERLRWLQELRSRSSEFYANLDMNYSLLKRQINPQTTPAYQQAGDELAKTVMIECNQIILLLNPKKHNQQTMRDKCNEALTFFQECVELRNKGSFNFDDVKYAEIKSQYFNALTEIGIETWKQIKELS
ncbi:hypothetical protein ZH93_18415 [Salmonella enterica subsp. enterica serovar Corvallis]|uniref:hypothetical protein n=1 Tax=Citrobacter sp. DNRA3 TaxID=2723054 RepID=UPI00107E441E|nr:hypothetical protein [Citrobacter sp. DNRA3]EBY1977436.1 hypothetical protein [Salmonella enterica subsp. enterica serovar Corvallis]ECH9053877.1 hypothetical protein [Salmonella enterica subsp. enterica serovar 4,[5],12:i:-]EDH2757573.1 hypothetical protein [Salmonella enterica]EDU9387724.1 hypothetical protein [Salmonella enterica subsp. enterica]NBJ31832.1 hypothetical protein [Citrobacter freundii]HDX4036606.1 hypothetical protein [Citrobacter youngae]